MNNRYRNGAGAGNRRRGIALVIVLGLMAMLIVMGLSFAVSMRTEQRAARMSGYQLGSMELMYYAVAEAMNHIETDLSSQPFAAPNWGNYTIHSGNNAGRAWLVRDATWGNNSLLNWYGAWFAPGGIVPSNAPSARNETNEVRWMRVYYPETPPREAGILSYMVLDCSGLLDANGNHETDKQLAVFLPRGPGTNVSELALSATLLKEMNPGGESNLVNGRVGIGRAKPFGRVETLPDIRVAGYAMYPYESSMNTTSRPLRSTIIPTNFYVLSRYPSGYSLGGLVATQQTYIGGTASELKNRHDQVVPFIGSLIKSPAEAETFFKNLIDFVDPDIVPGGLEDEIPLNGNNADCYCTEPVQMLNELQVMTVLRPSGASAVEIATRFRTELIFPFAYTSNYPSYPKTRLRIKGRYEGGTFADKNASKSFTLEYTNLPPVWVQSPTNMSLESKHFALPQITWYALASLTNAALPDKMVIEEWCVLDMSGHVLDRIAPDGAGGRIVELSFPVSFTPDMASLNKIYACSWAVNDPRINWNFSSHWTKLYAGRLLGNNPDAAPENSFGRMNPIAKAAPAEPDASAERGDPYMYVHNGPLRSVGDLGYLLFLPNRPWQTLNLIGAGSSVIKTTTNIRVLDFFTIFKDDVRYGLVNMNTSLTNVLATAFFNLPIEIAPGVPAPPPGNGVVSSAEALQLAAAIMAGRPSDSGFPNISNICLGQLHDAINVVPRITSWQAREGLVRNTCGLLGVRNNVFSIILSTQSRRQFVDPETGGSRTIRVGSHNAMATVWRDPFLVDGRHNMYLHTFRWYDEWVGGVDDYSSSGP